MPYSDDGRVGASSRTAPAADRPREPPRRADVAVDVVHQARAEAVAHAGLTGQVEDDAGAGELGVDAAA
jgi:hypothetical protein